VLAHGLAFALIQAGELTRSLREHADDGDALAAFAAATEPALRERYDLATALDEQRHRMWMGEPVEPRRHDGDAALFTTVSAGAAALVDPDVFRAFVRRIGLLDSTTVLDADLGLQLRIERILAELATSPRPAPGATRDEMLALTAAVAPATAT
jgi:2-keto-4-pentenoate hydratase